ncbi:MULTISPECIES: 16S rRNA (uracil(1498)-N(3))-methyltransferase [Subtercola]|uniref:Ribosomal RNA small subunit methyltransferase E n=1 Tax=Subtercola vilae TaxID=2056433 RepID=A0A4T2BT45_9MICO|nr:MULTISPECIES: 16S rRNA (uracil(1498)-N(3))-methyltransferase [Subtercola]MEA9985331.1 16S rRNA (uracil(1498)-N(3))-methyltransferase [Subtercola sp. RTI3]TIH34597.1 16S rRNA (uracil(1498)-N(3))-methyltransferase [Subtercola vilae]
MSSLFIREDLNDIPHEVRDVVSLHGEEQKHAVTVNRIKVGEDTSIGDGRGLIVSGPVIAVSSSVLSIAVTSVRVERRPAATIWLVQALAKGDRDEMAVQAATELGIDGVLPWAAERSVSRWVGPKVAKGVERWRTIVREASKQSIRAFVPTVGELAGIKQLIELASVSRMLVLEPSATEALTAAALPGFDAADFDAARTDAARTDGQPDLVLVVGPEGGISPNELHQLVAAGATTVKLGTSILRTSTAGPAALSALNVRLGRW